MDWGQRAAAYELIRKDLAEHKNFIRNKMDIIAEKILKVEERLRYLTLREALLDIAEGVKDAKATAQRVIFESQIEERSDTVGAEDHSAGLTPQPPLTATG